MIKLLLFIGIALSIIGALLWSYDKKTRYFNTSLLGQLLFGIGIGLTIITFCAIGVQYIVELY